MVLLLSTINTNLYLFSIFIGAAAAINYVFDDEIKTKLHTMFYKRIVENKVDEFLTNKEIYSEAQLEGKFVGTEPTVCR